jgi:hypothetical protein
VHEVVGGVDATQRPVQRGLIQDVPRYDLDRRLHFGSEFVGIAGEAAEPHALTFETGDESATDVAAAPGDQDGRLDGSPLTRSYFSCSAFFGHRIAETTRP